MEFIKWLWRGLFGPRQRKNWQQLAQEIGGEYAKGGIFRPNLMNTLLKRGLVASDGVQLLYKDKWPIELDRYTVHHAGGMHGGSSETFTRMRAFYSRQDSFSFSISRRGLLSGLGSIFGMKDIKIGVEEFDKKFLVTGNDESKVKALFEDPNLRFLVESQPLIDLKVKTDDGVELYMDGRGVITDIPRLKSMFGLFQETLNGLQRIGSAY